jgi:predicted phage tail component-like protein
LAQTRLTFNGIELPSFAQVVKIKNPPHPPISLTTSAIAGRPGSFYFGQNLGERTIDVSVVISADTKADLPAVKRALVDWLFYDAPMPLVLPSEPDKYYMAKVSGETDLDQLMNTGRGTITFICPDPFAYSTTDKTSNFVPGNPLTVTNDGDLEVYPQLHFEFTGSTTEFAVMTPDEYIYFGQPANVDSQTTTTKRTKVLDDPCSSVASYTAGVGVDGGTVTGTLMSDGSAIKASDYGSGSQWHGPAGVKSLGQQIQDFTVQVEAGFKSGYPYQVGRLEVYLLDVNNAIIGKIAIRDSNVSMDNPYMEARAGNLSTGRQFVNYTGPVGHWKQFNGPIRLTRIGQKWEFSASRRDSNGNLYNTFTYAFIDKDNLYNQKLAGIQIHFGTYGTRSAVSTNYIEQIQVWNEKTLLSTEVPYIFEPGDMLDIDCASGTVTKTSNGNQESFYYQMDPASSFIRLEKGSNVLSVYPNDIITNSYVTFRERWL